MGRNAVVIQPDYSNVVNGAARTSKLEHLVTSRDNNLALPPLLVLGLGMGVAYVSPSSLIAGAVIAQPDNDDNEGATVFTHSGAARHCQHP